MAEMQPDTVFAGSTWKALSSLELADSLVARVLGFLQSANGRDLVNVPLSGTGTDAVDDSFVVERLPVVGIDGAGVSLRRRRYDSKPAELLGDHDAIYLCMAPSAESPEHGFVIIDVGSKTDGIRPTTNRLLVCRRDAFLCVAKSLGMAGYGQPTVFRGAATESREQVCDLDEDGFVFSPQVLKRLLEESTSFLTGEVADRLRDWGVGAKRGILLHGPPGNGKTILTRLSAKSALDAGMNVIIIDGKRKSMLSYDRDAMGLGDELRRAASRGPALLIFEDIDLHCGTRTHRSGQSAKVDAKEDALAELLDFLDGTEPTDGYVLLATTNYLEHLDSALTRAGRFDLRIEVCLPGLEARVECLRRLLEQGPQPAPDVQAAANVLEGGSFAEVAETARRYKIAAAFDRQADLGSLLLSAAQDLAAERQVRNTEDGA